MLFFLLLTSSDCQFRDIKNSMLSCTQTAHLMADRQICKTPEIFDKFSDRKSRRGAPRSRRIWLSCALPRYDETGSFRHCFTSQNLSKFLPLSNESILGDILAEIYKHSYKPLQVVPVVP